MPENRKRIRKPKDLNYKENKKELVKMGRPSLEEKTEKELTKEMKDFAIMIARNIPAEIAGKHLKLSDYKIERYQQLPAVKTEIEHWVEIFGKENIEKYIIIDNKIIEAAGLEVLRMIEEGKASLQQVLDIWNAKIANIIKMMTGKEETEKEETTKITETVKKSKAKGLWDLVNQSEQTDDTEQNDTEQETTRTVERKTRIKKE